MWSVTPHTPIEGESIVIPDNNPRPDTFLVYDSFYASNAANESNREMKQKFSASCNTQRFAMLKDAIHRNFDADVIGESRSLYNRTTGEFFTYHYDRQKGVGKKYNYSWGLEEVTVPMTVKSMKGDIPGYGYYKLMFEICDNFNRALHDRPHLAS